MRCLILCVNYRSDDLLLKYMASVDLAMAQCSGLFLRVVVVDNSEAGDGLESLRAGLSKYRFVEVIAAPANLGYFGGARFGLNWVGEANSGYDLVIVSNVDVALEENFFIRLVALDVGASVGVVAPAIRSAVTGTDRNPKILCRPSRMRMMLYNWIFSGYFRQNAYEILSLIKHRARALLSRHSSIRAGNPGPSGTAPLEVYAAHGSFIIFTKEYFYRGGDLSYPCFLFGEEIFVAETCRRIGLSTLYAHLLVVKDKDHATTGILRSRRICGFMGTSTRYLLETYFSNQNQVPQEQGVR